MGVWICFWTQKVTYQGRRAIKWIDGWVQGWSDCGSGRCNWTHWAVHTWDGTGQLQTAALNVVCIDAPIITITSDNISLSSAVPLIIVENSTLTLQCRVDAYPPVDSAAVNWYKDAAVAGTCVQIGTRTITYVSQSFYAVSKLVNIYTHLTAGLLVNNCVLVYCCYILEWMNALPATQPTESKHWRQSQQTNSCCLTW